MGATKMSEQGLCKEDNALLGKLQLNSQRLTTTYLKQIAQSLELATRQLIEGKLQETSDVANTVCPTYHTLGKRGKLDKNHCPGGGAFARSCSIAMPRG